MWTVVRFTTVRCFGGGGSVGHTGQTIGGGHTTGGGHTGHGCVATYFLIIAAESAAVNCITLSIEKSVVSGGTIKLYNPGAFNLETA